MDRIIQSYAPVSPFGPTHPSAALAAQRLDVSPAAPGHAPSKATSNYLRALKRRAWLAAAIAALIIIPGSIYVLRQRNVYRAFAMIRIEPPTFDERIATIIPHPGIGQSSREGLEKYVPNLLAQLRSRSLADRAASNPDLHLPADRMEEIVSELVMGLTTRRLNESNTFDVSFEWTDPNRIALLLNGLLQEFAKNAGTESTRAIVNSKRLAGSKLEKSRQELADLDNRIEGVMRSAPNFTPDGKNALLEQQNQLASLLYQKRVRGDEFVQQQRLYQMTPHQEMPEPHNPHQDRINHLLELKERYTEQLKQVQRASRKYKTDPAGKHYTRLINETLHELEALQRMPIEEAPADQEPDLIGQFLAHHNEDLVKLEREVRALQSQAQASMPLYQSFLKLLDDRERLQESCAAMQERLSEFEFLAETQNNPVEIVQMAFEPNVPIRPRRMLSLAIVAFLGMGAGVGLVCALESFDRRVKVPEHLTAGLTLPLLGIVPRMRRLSRMRRGGHYWTPGEPYTPESDAFRNIRASLLGASSHSGEPIVTLLVTSAKAGEGKSTTALNLAATCAKAGERTLLLEVDLRRPSLAAVFQSEHNLGLVDVLRGGTPWQRAVVSAGSDLPNLDYLPCGDPDGIPVEVLGTLEMRQLLTAVSGHYHRVILDGPAVLGMADCRTLGRMVDASIMVVRCGAHDLSPLQRAKSMLELSKVPIAGVVFNALDEDLDNWSSHTLDVNAPQFRPLPAPSPRSQREPAEAAAETYSS